MNFFTFRLKSNHPRFTHLYERLRKDEEKCFAKIDFFYIVDKSTLGELLWSILIIGEMGEDEGLNKK